MSPARDPRAGQLRRDLGIVLLRGVAPAYGTAHSQGGDMRSLGLIPCLVAGVIATGAAAAAAEYPDRPVRLIVPQAPGSATDTVARILGAELAKELGAQIIVDNRPGGALTIGLDLTAKAA